MYLGIFVAPSCIGRPRWGWFIQILSFISLLYILLLIGYGLKAPETEQVNSVVKNNGARETTFSSSGHHHTPEHRPSDSGNTSIHKLLGPEIQAVSCKASNNLYNSYRDYSRYKEEDVALHRKDWMDWLNTTYITEHSSFEAASDTMVRKGLPAMQNERGIVTVLGVEHEFQFLAASIEVMDRLNLWLPVEVWSFSNELSDETVRKIRALSTIERPVTFRLVDDPRNYLSLEKGAKSRAYHAK
ncbi:hypothetical protein HDU67_008894, partial [Dinochytrium kinnereticum]